MENLCMRLFLLSLSVIVTHSMDTDPAPGSHVQSATGCTCRGNVSSTACACCTRGGCQCPRLTRASTCVQCGEEHTCPSDVDCDFINSEGCFLPSSAHRRVYSDAGVACARIGAQLPRLTARQIWQDVNNYAAEMEWDAVWTGARIRTLDWQWTKSGRELQYQGCFLDSPDVPDLSFLAEVGDHVTVEMCMRTCADLGYVYASVQFETKSVAGYVIHKTPSCRCGNELNHDDDDLRYQQQPAEACSTPCISNNTQYPCGAHYRHNVYRLGGAEFAAWDEADSSTHHCAMLHVTAGRWLKSDCQTEMSFICEYPELNSNQCARRGHRVIGDRCVSLETEQLSWHFALSECAFFGGVLVEVDGEEFHEELVSILHGSDPAWWIGLTNRQFQWPDGRAVTYMNWAVGQPGLANSKRVCVELQEKRGYRARAVNCKIENHVLCQLVYGLDTAALLAEYQQMEEELGEVAPPPRRGIQSSAESQEVNNFITTNNGEKKESDGAAIGAGIGVACLVLIVIVAAFILYQKNRKRKRQHREEGPHSVSNKYDSSASDAGSIPHKFLQETYDNIDDTYQRLDGAVTSHVPTVYSRCNSESYDDSLKPPGGPIDDMQCEDSVGAPPLPPRPQNLYLELQSVHPSIYEKPQKHDQGDSRIYAHVYNVSGESPQRELNQGQDIVTDEHMNDSLDQPASLELCPKSDHSDNSPIEYKVVKTNDTSDYSMLNADKQDQSIDRGTELLKLTEQPLNPDPTADVPATVGTGQVVEDREIITSIAESVDSIPYENKTLYKLMLLQETEGEQEYGNEHVNAPMSEA